MRIFLLEIKRRRFAVKEREGDNPEDLPRRWSRFVLTNVLGLRAQQITVATSPRTLKTLTALAAESHVVVSYLVRLLLEQHLLQKYLARKSPEAAE